MFEPIEGERQCPKCLQCKPLSHFVARPHFCLECRRAYGRERYRRLYAKPRKAPVVPREELALVRKHYPEGGSFACLKRLPAGWTASRVQHLAKKHRIRYVGPPPGAQKAAREMEQGWAVPAHTLTEQLDCIRLRRWRYPVEAGALAWRLA